MTLLLLACTDYCPSLETRIERDWCHFEEALSAAKADDLDRATEHLDAIADRAIASAATKGVIQEAPLRMDAVKAMSLCESLDSSGADACLRLFGRPHLWPY
ncbi:MAG TPA: hypothetical protein QGF58_28985 [Myxococcota bacterium]|nr:hypothetical protein [Myxococcota bacterium]